MTQRQESFRINHLEAGEKKRNSSDPTRTHTPLLLQACFGAAQAKGRVSRSNFPWMQGTIEPRVVFVVKTLPSSSFCSSTPDKGDVHAETGSALLHPAVPRCGVPGRRHGGDADVVTWARSSRAPLVCRGCLSQPGRLGHIDTMVWSGGRALVVLGRDVRTVPVLRWC